MVRGYGGGGPLGEAGPFWVSELAPLASPSLAEPAMLVGAGGESDPLSSAARMALRAGVLTGEGAGAAVSWSGAGGGCEVVTVGCSDACVVTDCDAGAEIGASVGWSVAAGGGFGLAAA